MTGRNTKSANKAAACDKEGINVVSFLVVVKSEVGRSLRAINNDVKSVQITLNKVVEAKKRKANIMLLGLKEGADDDDRVHKIINHLTDGVFGLKNVLKVIRLGKKGDKIVRPIFLRFDDAKIKELIFKNIRRMKTLDDSLKNIRLSHDLTIQQRSELKKLLDDAKRKKESCKEGFLYRVIGEVGKWKIVQFFAKKDSKSIMKKVDTVHELICDGLDVMVLTETWHGLDGNFAIGLAKPPGFQFVDYIREHDPGHGGLIVYFRKEFKHIKS
ncbi:hypothetical protein HELRODRAFT_166983 [Helobdella robusta]|uniref:Uncharacterized protein n=1 Tax=Helobdella robusta TaxID=6412 RepID=T1EYU5_HELRO|nr:hypothetical protein HELRODRAFT_166983 [Helobdella robusta]ESO11892.1 hypothetical protein HELRODRAFT_166983 [Helobdella robusta]